MPDRKRVLYVDDDVGLGRLMTRSLGAAGYEVEHVTDGEAALERLAAGGYHIVALDHHLESENGLDLLPRIRALEDAPPVIFVTGSDDVRIAVAAMKSGAIDYVWKDVQGHYRELLVASIASALEQEEMRRAKLRADEEIRAGKRRAEVLLAEVNHRVANSLSIVMALARMQAASSSNEAVIDALDEIQARVSAIAGVHRRLYTSVDVRFVEMDAYLEGLIEEMNDTLVEFGRPQPIALRAETGLLLPTDKAVSVGVAMNELITNARKYAYPAGTPKGDIRVRFQLVEGGKARLSVEDDGIGWGGGGDAQGTGIGSQIVNAMASTLRTTLVYEPRAQGTCAVVEFEVEPRDT